MVPNAQKFNECLVAMNFVIVQNCRNTLRKTVNNWNINTIMANPIHPPISVQKVSTHQ